MSGNTARARFGGARTPLVVGLVVTAVLGLTLATRDARPARPTNVTATAWAGSAIVRWSAPPTRGGGRIVSYQVVSPRAGIAITVPGSQTWARVSGLRKRVGYHFAVTAVDEDGRRSPPSTNVEPLTPLAIAIHVRGNQLVDAAGDRMRLLGVNRSGGEYACVTDGGVGSGIFGGRINTASIAAMASWHINAVRVPLNEDCWLGINGVKPAYSGERYRRVVGAYVHALNAAGLVAILDLHWNAPGGRLALGQQPMADADHAPAFWTSVATAFRYRPGVIFDLYNEPHDVSWDCWQRGCTTPDGWRTAGMQSLVDAVRQAGARQPILLGGLNYANDLSGWLAHPVHDPLHQLIAGVHVYDTGPPGYCDTAACWNRRLVPVARRVPILTGELGDIRGGRSGVVASYLRWADDQWRHGRSVSALAWGWDPALGAGGAALVNSYDGTPTALGRGFRDYLEGLSRAGWLSPR